jgi:DNA-binding NarL/FixJ family response regulator
LGNEQADQLPAAARAKHRQNFPNKVIAGVLDISTWTVCTYMRRIFAKLNVTTRAAMVTRLHRDGLL